MKVAFIDPPGIMRGVNVGLAYLAAVLRQHKISCRIFNINNGTPSISQLGYLLHDFQPDVICWSAKSHTWRISAKMAEELRVQFPEHIPFAVGGPHVTLMHNIDTNANFAPFDYAFIGDAETFFPSFLLDIKNNVRGKSTLTSRTQVIDMSNERPRLETLPFPSFEDFMPPVKSVIREHYPLVTSRGCPHQCIFCSVGIISGHRWRARSPKHVVEELIKAKKDYSIRGFEVIDDNFTLNGDRAKEICRMLLQYNLDLTWQCLNGLRADGIDAELATLMYRGGCSRVYLGVESADQEVFDSVNKGETLDDIRSAICILREAGITVGGFFIIGLPGDSREKSRKALDFIKEAGLESVLFNLYVPYPGTKGWEWVKNSGRMLSDFTDGAHLSSQLKCTFETDDFPAYERTAVYYKLNLVLKQYRWLIPKYDSLRSRQLIWFILKLMWRYDRLSIPAYVFQAISGRIRSWDKLDVFVEKVHGLGRKK